MPPKESEDCNRLFWLDSKGDKAVFNGIPDVNELSEPTESILKRQAEELLKRIHEAQGTGAVLMNSETFLLFFTVHVDVVDVKDNEFFLDGLHVFTSPYFPLDKIYVTDIETAEEIARRIAEQEEQAEQESYPEKKEPAIYHCRICGAAYDDKRQAKECVRTHEWQNRRGRR